MMKDKTTLRAILTLRIMCILVLLVQIYEIAIIYSGKYPIILMFDGKIWTKQITDLALGDRIATVFILEVFCLAWLYVVYQFWALCNLYQNNLIFTSANARRFKKMSIGLIIMSISDSTTFAMIGDYLIYRGIITQMPDIDPSMVIDVNFLAAGVMFWLMTKIMERACILQEDADLTV